VKERQTEENNGKLSGHITGERREGDNGAKGIKEIKKEMIFSTIFDRLHNSNITTITDKIKVMQDLRFS
jgi:hypothetical protein